MFATVFCCLYKQIAGINKRRASSHWPRMPTLGHPHHPHSPLIGRGGRWRLESKGGRGLEAQCQCVRDFKLVSVRVEPSPKLVPPQPMPPRWLRAPTQERKSALASVRTFLGVRTSRWNPLVYWNLVGISCKEAELSMSHPGWEEEGEGGSDGSGGGDSTKEQRG